MRAGMHGTREFALSSLRKSANKNAAAAQGCGADQTSLGCIARAINLPLDRGIDAMLARCKFEKGVDPTPIGTIFQRMQCQTRWSPSLQHILDSAAPRLDFVDFVAAETVVSPTFAAELAKIPEFSAAVSAYRSQSTLGHGGFMCWPAVHKLFRHLAEEPLLDYLRVAAYCTDLPADDRRRVNLEHKSGKQRLAVVFRSEDSPPARPGDPSSPLAETGSFAARHELRELGFAAVKSRDEDEYIDYWIGRSEPQIARYLENPRFCAGLDAFGRQLLSFHGFLEKVFGRDYYDNVLGNNHYALFHDLRSDLTGRLVARLANQVVAGERPIAPDLRDRFPEIYVDYRPEIRDARK